MDTAQPRLNRKSIREWECARDELVKWALEKAYSLSLKNPAHLQHEDFELIRAANDFKFQQAERVRFVNEVSDDTR